VVPGTGSVINVVTVLAGATVGVLVGDRLPQKTRSVVTDGLGLVTLLIAAEQAAAVLSPELAAAVGRSRFLVVLGAVLVGGIAGSLLRIESRLEALGATLQRRFRRGPADEPDDGSRATYVEGFVVASLVFCVGPLTVLGALQDGMGEGIELLALKATLDGFAALAFASTFGWGVAASSITVAVVQGAFTLLGLVAGETIGPAERAALTATGGLLLGGVGLRLLRIRDVPVGDLLPALVVAPLLAFGIARLR
jgi:uncharacterized membrane protein YqgA involved in biofilm formation